MGIGRKVKFRYYISFFLLLDLKDQNAIVKEIFEDYKEEYNYNKKSILNPAETSEILFFICNFRNKCAHDERIYQHKHKFTSGKSPNPFIFKDKNIKFNNDVFALIVSLKIFLIKENYIEMINKINELISKLPALLPNHYKKILNKMGFSNDWENIMLEIIK